LQKKWMEQWERNMASGRCYVVRENGYICAENVIMMPLGSDALRASRK
jgi:hypothetical protein